MEFPGAANGGGDGIGEFDVRSWKKGRLGLTRTRFRRLLKVAKIGLRSVVGLSRRRTVLLGRGETGSAISFRRTTKKEGGRTRTAEVDSQRPLYVHLLTWKAVRDERISPIGDESRLREGETAERSRLEDSLCRILEDSARLPFDALLEHSGSGFRPVRDEGAEEKGRRIGRRSLRRRLRVRCSGEMRGPRWDWRRWSGHAKSPVMLVEALQYEEDESNSVGREVRWRGTKLRDLRRNLPRLSFSPSTALCALHKTLLVQDAEEPCRQRHHRPSSSSERASLAP